MVKILLGDMDMKFLLQTRAIPFDFELELLRAQEFYLWKSKGTDKTKIEVFLDTEPLPLDFMSLCPVGSVEFVTSWMSDVHGIRNPKPHNVPGWMQVPWCTRRISDIVLPCDLEKLFPGQYKLFIKSGELIKHGINGVYDIHDEILGLLSGTCQISEYINPDTIISEHRVFVWNHRVLDIKCYSGDPWTMPEKYEIFELVGQYQDHGAPRAYTLDVMMRYLGDLSAGNGDIVMEVVEVHDFFSCGLYGFSDLQNYPKMLYSWFLDSIRG